MPQIYWPIGYTVADYKKVLAWWDDVVDGTNVDLYVGMAGYKAGSSNTKSAWYGIEEIKRQIDLNNSIDNVKGYCMFRYSSIVNNSELSNYLKSINK